MRRREPLQTGHLTRSPLDYQFHLGHVFGDIVLDLRYGQSRSAHASRCRPRTTNLRVVLQFEQDLF